MALAPLLLALLLLVPAGSRLGGKGEAGTVAAALLTVLVVVVGLGTLA